MQILHNILTPGELHMMYLLVNDIIINVNIVDKTGEDILTAIGICQGDCLSALIFIIYLAYALEPLSTYTDRTDHRETMWSALDKVIDKDSRKVEIDPKYADDITFIRSQDVKINQVARLVLPMLADEGLLANNRKTERYYVSKNSGDFWEQRKYLGSLLGTEADIKRRMVLAYESYRAYENILDRKRTSEQTRIRIFKQYVECFPLLLWVMDTNADTGTQNRCLSAQTAP